MKRFKKISEVMLASPIYTFSVIFLTLLIVLSLVAPLIPIDPNATDVSNMSQPPSWSHLFGTDEVGRDYFIRVVYGGRVSLFVGVLAMITATFIGTLVGLVSGYFGGWIDNLLMRLVDVLSSIPWLVLTLIVAASASISGAIMTESALSFLGLGIQQPMASWGSLLQNAQNSLQRAPYMAILPGLFVIFTIYSFNNIGDMIKHVLQREV